MTKINDTIFMYNRKFRVLDELFMLTEMNYLLYDETYDSEKWFSESEIEEELKNDFITLIDAIFTDIDL